MKKHVTSDLDMKILMIIVSLAVSNRTMCFCSGRRSPGPSYQLFLEEHGYGKHPWLAA